MLRVGDKVLVRDNKVIFEGEIMRVSAYEDTWYYIEPGIGYIKTAGGTSWYSENKVSLIQSA